MYDCVYVYLCVCMCVRFKIMYVYPFVSTSYEHLTHTHAHTRYTHVRASSYTDCVRIVTRTHERISLAYIGHVRAENCGKWVVFLIVWEIRCFCYCFYFLVQFLWFSFWVFFMFEIHKKTCSDFFLLFVFLQVCLGFRILMSTFWVFFIFFFKSALRNL